MNQRILGRTGLSVSELGLGGLFVSKVGGAFRAVLARIGDKNFGLAQLAILSSCRIARHAMKAVAGELRQQIIPGIT